MTLSDLKHYFLQHRRATLTDLVNHFRSDEQTLQPMLQQWERKGKLRHTHHTACTKGCCGAAALDIYEWTEGSATRIDIQPVSAQPACHSRWHS